MPDESPIPATLEFDPGKVKVTEKADLRTGLSGIASIGDDLWLACDEGCRLERLSRSTAAPQHFASHASFGLETLLDLPAAPTEEADIEGMDVDDGFLWLVGSHSSKRKLPDENDTAPKIAEKLGRVPKRDGNRHLLARIPLDGREPKKSAAGRAAGSIPRTDKSSALLDAIVASQDPHLAPFVGIPGKDNGLDIEGLAVRGSRVFVGLRGPVLREWTCLLELDIDADAAGALQLKPFAGGAVYRKHFVHLAGFGVRDLAWIDDDLLILAGPSMAHDGPTAVWRWRNAAAGGDARPDVSRALTVPHGEGRDRAEGMTVLESGAPGSLLIVFDSPLASRLIEPGSVTADVYRLP